LEAQGASASYRGMSRFVEEVHRAHSGCPPAECLYYNSNHPRLKAKIGMVSPDFHSFSPIAQAERFRVERDQRLMGVIGPGGAENGLLTRVSDRLS
jgi:hypothetical protein